MSENMLWLPLISGLSGALIGSLSSIITIIIQARFQAKRERTRLVAEMSIEQHKQAIEASKQITGRKVEISPVISYIYYNSNVLKLIDENQLTPEKLKELDEKMDKIHELVRKPPKNSTPS